MNKSIVTNYLERLLLTKHRVVAIFLPFEAFKNFLEKGMSIKIADYECYKGALFQKKKNKPMCIQNH